MSYRIGLAALAVTFGAASAEAATVYTDNSATENAALFAAWSSAIGESPDFTQDFETGYTDGQAMNGADIGGGATIEGVTATTAIESGAGSIGGSNPIGGFALEAFESNDQYLINFASPMDYISLYYIDLTGMSLTVTTANGPAGYQVDTTAASGDSAEFWGYVAGSGDEAITSLLFSNVGGSAGWAVDNLAWGTFGNGEGGPNEIPLPASLPLLLVGVGAVWGLRRTHKA